MRKRWSVIGYFIWSVACKLCDTYQYVLNNDVIQVYLLCILYYSLIYIPLLVPLLVVAIQQPIIRLLVIKSSCFYINKRTIYSWNCINT